MSYECHITVEIKYAWEAAKVAQRCQWKTSEIARDPLLGEATYFYLTKHEDAFPRIFGQMTLCCNELEEGGIPVLRKKIELIVLDSKTGVGL